MSLTAILKQLERVNQRHQTINQRYNPHSRTCPRRVDLKEEDRQDQLTFGHSHSQMLKHLQETHHLTPFKSIEQTRPSTAMPTSYFRPTTATFQKSRTLEKRPLTAAKAAPYRQQYNFFFKEDIFGSEDKPMPSQIPSQTLFQTTNMQQALNHHMSSKQLTRLSRKAHRQQKKVFARTFNLNLEKIGSNQQRVGMSKAPSNKVLYQKKENNPKGIRLNSRRKLGDNVFHLTTPGMAEQATKKVRLSSSASALDQVRLFLNEKQQIDISANDRRTQYGRSLSLWQIGLGQRLPRRFSLTVITVDTLQSVTLRVRINLEGQIVEQNGVEIKIEEFLKQILTQHQMVQIYLHHESTLFVEQFVLNQSLSTFRSRHNTYVLVMYYLKRFLLYDGTTSLCEVKESAELIIKSNTQLPGQFGEFINEMKGKVCSIFDGDQRLYNLTLRDLLAAGVASIEAFKKEMGFGDCVLKLKKDANQPTEKLQYNWEYFYICIQYHDLSILSSMMTTGVSSQPSTSQPYFLAHSSKISTPAQTKGSLTERPNATERSAPSGCVPTLISDASVNAIITSLFMAPLSHLIPALPPMSACCSIMLILVPSSTLRWKS